MSKKKRSGAFTGYGRVIIIGREEFWDPTNPSNPSAEVMEIYNFIHQTAAPSLTLVDFIKEYENNFEGLYFRYMTDKRSKNKNIGFLMTVFQTAVNPDNGKLIYIAKCFPAFQKQYRNKAEFKYNRLRLYSQVISFYIIKKFPDPTIQDKLNRLVSSLDKRISFLPGLLPEITQIYRYLRNKHVLDDTEVRINIESPSTFNDIVKYNLISNLPVISDVQITEMLSWSEQDLRTKMDEVKNGGNFISPIGKAFFSVNIDEEEKNTHISNAVAEKNYRRIFFLWQNPMYPEFAFQARIPVTFKNIMHMMQSMIREQLITRINGKK